MFYQLPPVGERVVLRFNRRKGAGVEELFAPFRPIFYRSGTSALAAAVVAAIARTRLAAPEVILPAYGCPDLVSAVLAAGGHPRLVDLAPDRSWLDLSHLRAAIGPQTAAVVAVDLFGIPERYAEIRALLGERNIAVIQDSAQGLPRPAESRWQGDYVILSFGRGKPVSLLYGGAVLTRDEAFVATLSGKVVTAATGKLNRFPYLVRSQLYNLLLSAYLYWIPARLPFVRIGQTRFKPLAAIEGADPWALSGLPENIQAYWRRTDLVQRHLAVLIEELADPRILDLAAVSTAEHRPVRVLRYPVLVSDTDLRERLVATLGRAGLGVSCMYPSDLAHIPGLEARFAGQHFPQAERFARHIITLPTHSRVGPSDLVKIRECFLRCVRGSS